MVETIGNPLSWGARLLGGVWHSAEDVADGMASDTRVSPRVHRLEPADIGKALRMGLADLGRSRSDVLMLVIVYPLIGLALTALAFDQAMIPLIFPMVAGFALIGPLAGLRMRVMGPVMVLGVYMLAVYAIWIVVALEIYGATLGPAMPESMAGFVRDLFTTPAGWALIWIGCGVGFVFAALVLVTTMVSVPMLVDLPVGLPVAVAASLRVAAKNPLVVTGWGLTVAALLVIGSVPMFVGLVVVLPVLGHATWHLYRMAISFD